MDVVVVENTSAAGVAGIEMPVAVGDYEIAVVVAVVEITAVAVGKTSPAADDSEIVACLVVLLPLLASADQVVMVQGQLTKY